jgi:hypothetical protein
MNALIVGFSTISNAPGAGTGSLAAEILKSSACIMSSARLTANVKSSPPMLAELKNKSSLA